MERERPSVVVIAGPNGAGKSTMAARLLVDVLRVSEFLAADVFARGVSAATPESAALAAGRAMLRRLDELTRQRQSVGFETTLASRSFAPRIKQLLAAGYESHLVFLWLPSADLAVQRVAQRVRLGGHDVPEQTIRHRYRRLTEFLRALPTLTTTWRMYDNSTIAPRLVAHGQGTAARAVSDRLLWDRIRTGELE